MKIQILLNPEAPDYGALQPDILGEMNALGQEPGISLRTEKVPPPEGTLPVAEVFQFILEHKDEAKEFLPLVTAVIQLVVAVIRRRRTEQDQKTPSAVVIVDGHRLSLPAGGEKQRKFLAELKSPKKARKHAARRSPHKTRGGHKPAR